MNMQTISPSKRYLLAGIGYLLIYISHALMTKGAVWALAAVALYAAFAFVLLGASAPGLLRAEKKEASIHPVQAGKEPLLRRPSHQAVWNRA